MPRHRLIVAIRPNDLIPCRAMRPSITSLAALVLVISITGCSSDDHADASGDRLKVVATTTQIGSIAAEVGGEAIDLTVLLRPGVEAHDYEMTPANAAAVEDAALILRSGAGLENWLDGALATIGTDAVIADLSDGVALREAGEGAPGDGGGAAGQHVDPHYWLSGPNAIQMVQNAVAALDDASSSDSAAFDERAAALIGRLEAADAEVRELISEIPEDHRGIVTNHDALGYFIDEYGLRFVGSVFPNLDVSAEPNPRDLATLVETIRREGVVAIFSESAVNPELARTVAAETDAHFVDEPLYTDSLGPDGSGAETLDGMLLHNARVIHDALIES
jgi:zinc/manganese transport system substrate-binding protein